MVERDVAVADLRVAPLLRGLDDRQLAAVLAAGTPVAVGAGETVVEEGGSDRDLYVLLSGHASVLVRADDGELIAVGTLAPGDCFGELGALLAEPRAATVVQTEAGTLLRVPDAALVGLLERIGPLGLALARELARDLELALEQRNALQELATPDSVEVTASDLAASASGLARYYAATVRNLVRRNRLLTGQRSPTYRTALTTTVGDLARWHELFGADPATRLPLTVHARAWTPLLDRLIADLGVNGRNLRHARTRLTFHPRRPLPEPDAVESVQVTLTGAVPLPDRRVALLVETRVVAAAGEVRVSGEDVFVVADVDRDTVARLRREGTAAAPELPVAGSVAALDPDDPDVRCTGLALAGDLGTRYGRLSGNLNPVHTSAAAARLLGHRRPTLQHLAVANLVLADHAVTTGAAPSRLQLDFLAPVLVAQTVELRSDGRRVELTDAEGNLLVDGRLDGPGPASPGPHRAAGPGARPGSAVHAQGADLATAEAGLDPVALQRLLERTHHDLRDRVRALLAEDRFRPPLLPAGDAYRDQVMEWVAALAAEGLGGLAFPAASGGADDPAAAIAVFETLATGDLSLLIKYGVQFGLFGGAIANLGTAAHHERWLAAVASAELPGGFALTETGHGSDARSIRTTATYDPVAAEFTITTPDDHARKDYIGNAARHARAAVVFAQLEVADEQHGVHGFFVPLRDEHGAALPGVRIADCGHKMGLNGVDNGRLWFDGVRVPREHLLNRYGNVSVDGVYASAIANPTARFFTMLATLVQGRVSVGLAGVSTAKVALAVAVRYALRRRQFGPKDGPETLLLDYLSHQRRLLPALAATVALDVALHDLVDDFVALSRRPDAPARERQTFETRAAVLKALATWHGTATIQAAREACGGAGYLAENRFAALKADSDVFTTFEGDNTVLLQLVAKSLLTDYKSQFEDLDLAGMVRFVLGRVVAAVIPTPPSRRADRAHLRDPLFQRHALRSREELRTATLARRLRRDLERKVDVHDAFIRHQDLVLAAARAHGERLVHEALASAVERCEEPPLRAVLAALRDLHALSLLDADRAWYLEEGLFAGPKAKAIGREVNALCGELRPLAGDLVAAFGIPDALLAAPIAGGETVG